MKRKIGTAAVVPVVSFLVCAVLGFAQAPTIANVTNAAIPAIDLPADPSIPLQLAPRSIATIFGSQLADSTASAVPPWPNALGGTEVHIVVNPTQYGCNPCEQPAPLLYVSPTQINFVVPDNLGVYNSGPAFRARVVLIRDGVRYDNHDDVFGGSGLIGVDSDEFSDVAVFGVGYECLYSFSLTDPAACGASWSQGQHRAALGAVTDALGQLITSQNPVRQGELITLWMTGLVGLSRDPTTGLLQQPHPGSWLFGVAQNGKDIPATVYNDSFDGFGYVGQWATPPAGFAGESPQFVGLDQVNVTFPVCATNTKAKADQQYDAFLAFGSIVTATAVRIYVPFVVRAGDPDCQSLWGSTNTAPTSPSGTTTTLTSSLNPSVVGQAVTFTATVSPSAATGTVVFVDGGTALDSAAINGGVAILSTSSLTAGDHSITATYGGNNNFGSSSATRTQTVKAPTTTTLTGSPSPSAAGQSLIFTATVAPASATGTVTFSDGSNSLGIVTLSNGTAMCGTSNSCPTSGLGAGSHSIRAAYNGDNSHGASSATWTQIIKANTTTTLISSSNPLVFGQAVTFTAAISPCCIATGTVTFIDGSSPIGSGTLVYSSQNGTIKATFATSSLGAGSHSITATYGGDGSNNASTSAVLTQVVRPAATITLTSTPNPSVVGQSVIITATVTPSTATGTVSVFDGTSALITNLPLSGGKASFSVPNLSAGTHQITATYNGDSNNGNATSPLLTQTVTAH